MQISLYKIRLAFGCVEKFFVPEDKDIQNCLQNSVESAVTSYVCLATGVGCVFGILVKPLHDHI